MNNLIGVGVSVGVIVVIVYYMLSRGIFKIVWR